MKRPPRRNQELFDLAMSVVRHARSVHDETTAQAIHSALGGSFTASEVLGDIRSAFVACRPRLDDRYPEEMRKQVAQAIVEIDRAFRRVNQAR